MLPPNTVITPLSATVNFVKRATILVTSAFNDACKRKKFGITAHVFCEYKGWYNNLAAHGGGER